MIKIPASGNGVIMNDHNLPINNTQLLITRDNDQDHLDLSFYKDPFQLNNINSKITILSTFLTKSIIVDQLSDVCIDALPPSRVNIMFLFREVFKADSPIQTLRSWAGAHSGPLRNRHGLMYLIDAANETDTTILFLDLLTPEALSALDYIGDLHKIRDLINRGINGVLPFDSNIQYSPDCILLKMEFYVL